MTYSATTTQPDTLIWRYCWIVMDDIFRHNDPTKGAIIESQEVEGWVLPQMAIDTFLKGRTMQQQLDDIKNLALRDDDIIVCAFAKCGMFIFNAFQTLRNSHLTQCQEKRNCFHYKHFKYHMITNEIVVTGVAWRPWPWRYHLDSSPYRLQRVLVAVYTQ